MKPVATAVSVYSGCGGLDLGFALAGVDVVWANDIDPSAVATHNVLTKRLADFLPHVSKGERAHAGDIRAQVLPPKGSADLVIGGPPCQGFSVAGRMDPNDPRSKHVWDFLGVVEHIQPRAFVMENVKALAQNRRWSSLLDDLIARAEELGYDTRLHVLDASHFEVPQARERMFLVGLRGGVHVDPEPVTEKNPPSVRDALAELPSYGEPGNDTLCVAKVTPARKPVMRRSPFAGMMFNGQGRPLNLDVPAPTLPASMGGNRTPIIDQRQLTEGEPCWTEEYHAHLWSGGEPYKSVPDRLRRLTVEEAAAIQTFPLGIDWAGPQSSKFRQIGNAVPPRLGYHVARAVLRALGLKDPGPTCPRLDFTEGR